MSVCTGTCVMSVEIQKATPSVFLNHYNCLSQGLLMNLEFVDPARVAGFSWSGGCQGLSHLHVSKAGIL